LSFLWEIDASGYNDQCKVEAKCGNVVARGVPFPERWKTALNCLSLHEQIQDSASGVTEFGISDVKCELLGQARAPMGGSIGKAIPLNDNGCRVVYILCGQVDDDEWFCHKGSYENGSLATNPFQEKDLMYRNIATETWDASVNKRLRSNSHLNILRGYVQINDYLWCELVAVANFRAEEIRAQKLGRKFDEIIAMQYFEQNPFLWESQGKWKSQSRLTTLWSWKRGEIHRAFEHVDCHNLIARGAPIPKALRQSDKDLLQRLLSIAELETKENKCPCRYLGMQKEDKFMPDPSEWGTTKTSAYVFFEWSHVSHNGLPHRASCIINDLLNLGRSFVGHFEKHVT